MSYSFGPTVRPTRRGIVPAMILVIAAAFATGQQTDNSTGVESRPSSSPASRPVHITFIHVNDIHGMTLARTSGPGSSGGSSVGGYARLATYVQQVRTAGGADRFFFVHAGDELSRADELTRRTLGAANVQIWNYLKLDYYTPGNGDYYDGVDVLQKMIAPGKFTTLTSNVKIRATGATLGQPYAFEKVGPVAVAFMGLCTVRALPSAAPLDVLDATETAAKIVPELRKKADLVVVVSHLGYDEDKALAAKVDGIDLIIGAHSHTVVQRPTVVKSPTGRDTLVAQTGEQLMYCGRIDMELSQVDGKWLITSAKGQLTPLDEKVKPDPTVAAMLDKMLKATTKPAEAVNP